MVPKLPAAWKRGVDEGFGVTAVQPPEQTEAIGATTIFGRGAEVDEIASDLRQRLVNDRTKIGTLTRAYTFME